MKRLVSILVMGLGFSAMASDVLLDRTDGPVRRFGDNVVSVSVLENGDVVGQTCPANLSLPEACTTKRVAKLSKATIRRIENQIDGAKLDEIIYPDPGGIHCLAIPTRRFNYSALNGEVLLKAGTAPCGFVTYRDGTDSELLVKRLDKYFQQYRNLVGNDELDQF